MDKEILIPLTTQEINSIISAIFDSIDVLQELADVYPDDLYYSEEEQRLKDIRLKLLDHMDIGFNSDTRSKRSKKLKIIDEK